MERPTPQSVCIHCNAPIDPETAEFSPNDGGDFIWRDITSTPPPATEWKPANREYLLVVDAKGRMSIAYCYNSSTGEIGWTMAKPIGAVTHWMPLPPPPMKP